MAQEKAVARFFFSNLNQIPECYNKETRWIVSRACLLASSNLYLFPTVKINPLSFHSRVGCSLSLLCPHLLIRERSETLNHSPHINLFSHPSLPHPDLLSDSSYRNGANLGIGVHFSVSGKFRSDPYITMYMELL